MLTEKNIFELEALTRNMADAQREIARLEDEQMYMRMAYNKNAGIIEECNSKIVDTKKQILDLVKSTQCVEKEPAGAKEPVEEWL